MIYKYLFIQILSAETFEKERFEQLSSDEEVEYVYLIVKDIDSISYFFNQIVEIEAKLPTSIKFEELDVYLTANLEINILSRSIFITLNRVYKNLKRVSSFDNKYFKEYLDSNVEFIFDVNKFRQKVEKSFNVIKTTIDRKKIEAPIFGHNNGRYFEILDRKIDMQDVKEKVRSLQTEIERIVLQSKDI